MIVNNFISDQECEYIKNITFCNQGVIENEHIRKINEGIKGSSVLLDMSCTEVSRTVSAFQGDATVISRVDPIFYVLKDRIADTLKISKEHVFFQHISVGSGGKVGKHYDAGMPGYITYKCNVCVDGPRNDIINVEDTQLIINKSDLYAFEANLFKHWMDSSDQTRVLLSYGFLLPYKDLGWEEDCPRVRLSNRIWKAFIHGK